MTRLLLFAAIFLSFLGFAQSQSIPSIGLVGYYPFNGNANDESGNLNNGVLNGPVLTNDRFGNMNSAYLFDGIDDWINLGNDPSLHYSNLTSNSISVWIKSNSIQNKQNIIRYDDMDTGDGDSNNPRALLMLRLDNFDGDGDLDVRFTYGVADPISTTNNFTYATDELKIDEWHHLVSIKDEFKDSSYLYLDGELVYSQQDVSVGVWETTGQYMMLGNYNLNSILESFSGVMDDIRFYNVAITPCEVLALYHENDTNYISDCIPTGIDEGIINPSINIYPNPASNYISIFMMDLENASIRIVDIIGKEHYSLNNINTSKINVLLDNYKSGIYFVQLSSVNKQKTVKFIIED